MTSGDHVTFLGHPARVVEVNDDGTVHIVYAKGSEVREYTVRNRASFEPTPVDLRFMNGGLSYER